MAEDVVRRVADSAVDAGVTPQPAVRPAATRIDAPGTDSPGTSTAPSPVPSDAVGASSSAQQPARPVSESPLVQCLDAYADFKRSHVLQDGAFYIVHDGAVLDEPLPSREDAMQVLRAAERDGAAVNWRAVLVLEAGNEWGERDASRSFMRIATCEPLPRQGRFESAKARVQVSSPYSPTSASIGGSGGVVDAISSDLEAALAAVQTQQQQQQQQQ
jgi:hypothetical protein